MSENFDRRAFFTLTGSGLALLSSHALSARKKSNTKEKEEEVNKNFVSPAEDLMREHGILERVLLIYEEVQKRITFKEELEPSALNAAATVVHEFIENYHEKMEEDYLFPRFYKAKVLEDLCTTLKSQHEAGRKLTEAILKKSEGQKIKDQDFVNRAMGNFIRMYRPHAAREDTVLFPAIRKITSAHEYKELGEMFEQKEHDLFGRHGFRDIIQALESIEKKLHILDLSKFTPG